ncbi:hypothetical protein F5Y11DRAFT_334777 [Daldinia sp. FL1419]|nr:hypothetical protein F5Y11DRAFT_334777 [Daldinia sp. FL1419]
MSSNSPPSNNIIPSMRRSLFSHTNSIPFPSFPHEPDLCSCGDCATTRLSRRMDLRFSHVDIAGNNISANIRQSHHEVRTSRRSSARRSDSESRAKHHQSPLPVAPPQLRAGMAYPEIYVYPGKSHHITFPVVNYSTAYRAQNRSSWPACYLAISPQCAEPADFEAALSPPGSGLVVVARLSKTQKTSPLGKFRDAADLRKDLMQLEVWDEDAIQSPPKRNQGTAVETDVSDGTEAGTPKNKKRSENPV